MKNFITILLLSILLNTILLSNDIAEINHVKQPNNIAIPLLKKIEKHSISFGSGKKIIYAFVDPMCPHSQNFIEMVYNNKNAKKIYTYKIFLLHLKKFDSKDVILKIYSDLDNINSNLIDFMVLSKNNINNKISTNKNSEKISKEILIISNKLDIYKRPYLFVVKNPKEFE